MGGSGHIRDSLGAIPEAELSQEVTDVMGRGLSADEEPLSDLGV